MKNAIRLLKIEAEARRSMSVPNSNTITEYTANQNKLLADEYDAAIEWLKVGMKELSDSCHRNAERRKEQS